MCIEHASTEHRLDGKPPKVHVSGGPTAELKINKVVANLFSFSHKHMLNKTQQHKKVSGKFPHMHSFQCKKGKLNTWNYAYYITVKSMAERSIWWILSILSPGDHTGFTGKCMSTILALKKKPC